MVEPITVEFNKKQRYLYVATMPQEQTERDMVIEVGNYQIVQGRMLKPSDQFQVIVSEDYINSPKFNNKALALGDKITIQNKTVTVVGIFKKSGNPFIDM